MQGKGRYYVSENSTPDLTGYTGRKEMIMFLIKAEYDNNWDKFYSTIICAVDTEEKAKAEVERLEKETEGIWYRYGEKLPDVLFMYEEIDSSSDWFIKEQSEEKSEFIADRINELEKRIKGDEVAFEQLKRIKEIFAPLHLEQYTEETVRDVFPELHNVIMENELPVNLYDGEYDYNAKGKTECGKRERLTYNPMSIGVSSSLAWHYYYFGRNGYDIDDDIKRLEESLVEDNEELTKLKGE